LTTTNTASNSDNFAAGEPVKVISVPYAYTPTSAHAELIVSVACRAVGDSGTEHSGE